jgi:MFS family permease
VAPALSQAWAVDKATLGLLLSSGLVGMAFGSLALSPLADKVGRRPLVFGGLALMIVGSLLSAFCHTIPTLAACRVITGVGIGVMVPLTMSLAAEFSNARMRPFAVAITTVGFTMGSVAGGLIASVLLQYFSWPSVFISGAIAGVILLPVVAFILPESPVFILSRRPPNALEKINQVLARLQRSQLTELPPSSTVAKSSSYRDLFGAEMIGITFRLAAIFMLVSTTAYFLLNWLPQLIADAGFPPSTGSLVSAAASLVGIGSTILLGALANRFGPALVAACAMIGLGFAIAVFGFTPPALPLLLMSACACGFCLSGATGVFYATMATTFPPLARVTGIGFVIGVGRVSSVLGPSLAGWMFTSGLTRGEVSLFFATAPVIAGLILLTSPARQKTAAQIQVAR